MKTLPHKDGFSASLASEVMDSPSTSEKTLSPSLDSINQSSSSGNSNTDDSTFSDDSSTEICVSSDDEDGISGKATSSKQHQCTKCPSSFRTHDSLLLHHRSHEGIKPYICTWPDCKHRTVVQSNLVKHIRMIHFNVPPTKKEQLAKNGAIDERNASDYIQRDEHLLTRGTRKVALNKRRNHRLGSARSTKLQTTFEPEFEPKTAPSMAESSRTSSDSFPCYFNQLGVCDETFTCPSKRLIHYRIHLSIKPYFCTYTDCTDNCRSEEQSGIVSHLRQIHGIEENENVNQYIGVDEELLHPCFTTFPN